MKNANPTLLDTLPHRGDEPHLLREILRTYQVLMAGFARQTGIPAARFVLMRLLANAPEGVGITELARQLGINPAAVTRQVQELEVEGLIRRRAVRRDGRRTSIRLSAKGEKLFAAIHARTHELEQSLALALGADKMRNAALVLRNLRVFVENRR